MEFPIARRLNAAATLGAAVGVGLAGCLPPSPPPEAFDRGTVEVACCEVQAEPVEVVYLGVGGWLIRRGGASLLTAPFFSNPDVLEAGLDRIHADPDRIDAHLPDVADVPAILVGHGHYDHLMDVPWILEHRAPEALVLGSRTVAHQLAPFGFGVRELEEGPDGRDSRDRVVVVEGPDVATPERAGRWIHVSEEVRVMALESNHPPHFGGIVLYSGRRTRDLPEPPTSANEWLDGRTLAWLVDLLEPDGSVGFRIYYQDAAGADPWGSMPPLDDGIPVDLALIVPATYSDVFWHPEAILEDTSPRHVLVGHWEDFFEPPSRPARPVPFTLLPDFISRLERALPDGVGYHVPVPGTRFLVR